MAQLEIDIRELFNFYFGYIGLPFPKPQKQQAIYVAKTYDWTDKLTYEGYNNKKDFLGRFIFMPVELEDLLLEAVAMNLQVQKKIVKTAVAGRQGTVKELISTQDYKITLKGFLINRKDNNYPTEQVEKLKNIFEKNTSITIKSPLTDIFEITKVVIESLNLPETKHQNIQPFSMSLLSDDDFTAILNED